MKFLVFLALFSVLSTVYCDDVWVDLSPSDLDDFEVNQALNFGASNVTQDAIARGHIPDGTYHISAIESAQKEVDVSDNDGEETDVTDDNDQDWDNNYRFKVEISNGEGSGLTANYTVHVDANTVDGDVVYSFYVSHWVYNWFTNQDQGEFGEDEFEWVHENEWNEFTPAEDDVEGASGSGTEAVADNTDGTDDDGQVLVVPEDGGEAEWVDANTINVN